MGWKAVKDSERIEYAEIYAKAEARLLSVMREMEAAHSNKEIEVIKRKIRPLINDLSAGGKDLGLIYTAASALEMAAGLQKIKGGAGSRAYEKITDLRASASQIRSEVNNSQNNEGSTPRSASDSE